MTQIKRSIENVSTYERFLQLDVEQSLINRRQSSYNDPQDITDCQLVAFQEARIVDMHEKGHQKLTIHAIRQSTVAWNRVCKVFYLEGPFESTSEKASKRCNQ